LGNQKSDVAVENRASVSDLSEIMPAISSPVDVVYFFGEVGNTIEWSIADDNPSFWMVLKDASLVELQPWIELNETVTINIDGLEVGVYDYEIIACTYDYNISDSVIVTVLYDDLTPHASFSITSNSQWASRAASESWLGNGTESNPYIIEKYIFDITNTGIGIYSTTAFFIIRNCTFVSTGIDYSIGIDLQNTINGEIVNCTFTKLWVGVIVWSSEGISWESNLFSSLSYGLLLQESISCSINLNTFYSGGISIIGYELEYWIHDVNYNQVNGKSLGYFNGLSGAHINGNDYGQVILLNSTYSWIDGGSFEDIGDPIHIGHSFGCRIGGAEISHCSTGIFIERSNNTYVISCVIQDSASFGIQINESANCLVMDSNITDVEYPGIVGIVCYNTSLHGNVVTKCGDSAIALWGGDESSIVNNIVENNQGTGIGLGACSNSFLRDNIVMFNTGWGIQIYWGSYCTIYRNTIGYNEAGNAYDDGTDNYWDDGIGTGNWWSDYGGAGYYYIDGAAGSIDHFPNAAGIADPPTINHPPDITYTYGTTGHFLSWTASSLHPSFYIVLKDGDVFANNLWLGSTVNVDINGFSVGSYTFTIFVVDTFEQNATDTVIVNVTPAAPTIVTNATTTSTTTNGTINEGLLQQITIMVSLGSVGVIIIVVVLIVRSRPGTAYGG